MTNKIQRVIQLKPDASSFMKLNFRTQAFNIAMVNGAVLKVVCCPDGYVSILDNLHLKHFITGSVNEFDDKFHLLIPELYTTLLEKPMEN